MAISTPPATPLTAARPTKRLSILLARDSRFAGADLPRQGTTRQGAGNSRLFSRSANGRNQGSCGTVSIAVEKAIDFELTDHEGKTWRLADHLARGPVLLVFYRGDW